jgi:hypothetical protein
MTRTLQIFCLFLVSASLFSCHHSTLRPGQEKKEAQLDGVEQAMWQEFRMTRDPQLGIIPNERMIAARNYMESLANPANRPGGVTAVTWQERGPTNIGGRTRAMIIDKRDATGNTVFAGFGQRWDL